MRKVIMALIMIIVVVSCNNSSTINTVNSPQNFDWLIGNWMRINNKENQTTFENWEKKNDSKYTAFGYTLQNKDTTWQENIVLTRIDNSWSFNVTGKGEITPTKFILTTIENGKFICENPENEFPKQIEYIKNGDKLDAKISGGDMEVIFNFKKRTTKKSD